MLVLHGVLNFEDFLTGVVPTGPRKGFEQDKHNQINLDSQSARIYLAEKISYNLLKYGYRAWDRSHNYEQKNAK